MIQAQNSSMRTGQAASKSNLVSIASLRLFASSHSTSLDVVDDEEDGEEEKEEDEVDPKTKGDEEEGEEE